MSSALRFAAPILTTLVLVACNGDGEGAPEETPNLSTATNGSSTQAPAQTDAPEVSIPDTEPASHIELPSGFSAYAIAEGFLRPTSIALGPDGSVFISERHGNVFRLVDADSDGVFEDRVTFADGFLEITGLLVAPGGGVYVSQNSSVVMLHDSDGDGVADDEQDIVTDLPVGLHQNNGLVFGPDGKLYLTSGAPCDDNCTATSDLHAAILQLDPDGGNLRPYAGGLRNPYDLVFDRQNRLWATDNGSDIPCESVDELNLIVEGGDYGWPYAQDGCDPLNDGVAPIATLGLHTASTGIDVYEATHFPPEHAGDLFVTLWGSLDFPEDPLGGTMVRVIIEDAPGGPSGRVEPFASGFRNHPIDVLVDADGTLLVLDYGTDDPDLSTGTLYRIIYTG